MIGEFRLQYIRSSRGRTTRYAYYKPRTDRPTIVTLAQNLYVSQPVLACARWRADGRGRSRGRAGVRDPEARLDTSGNDTLSHINPVCRRPRTADRRYAVRLCGHKYVGMDSSSSPQGTLYFYTEESDSHAFTSLSYCCTPPSSVGAI